MPPGVNITTTTNQFLARAWVDQVLRDNLFFGEILSNTESWNGSQMLFPRLIPSPFVSRAKCEDLMGK